jgi:hypothetical protein
MYSPDLNHIILVRNGKSILLRSSHFRDVTQDKPDPDKNQRLIPERVFTRGNIQEFGDIQPAYTLDEIKQDVVRIGTPDRKTMNFLEKTNNIQTMQL